MTERRSFLSLGAGLVASALLPGCRSDDVLDTFGRRGSSERLAVSYAHVHIGLRNPFSVLHISDTHLTAAYPDEGPERMALGERRTACFGGLQEVALRSSLDWARAHTRFVLHTGDLIDWHSRANLDLAKRYFGEGLSTAFALGNHEFQFGTGATRADRCEANKERFRPALAESYPIDQRLQSTVVNGVNFVTMDDAFGTVTEHQVERFEAEVAKRLPIVLAMHVPILTPELQLASWRFWERKLQAFEGRSADVRPSLDLEAQSDGTTAAFIARLRREPLLKCILCGHEHFTYEEQFSASARQYVVGANFLFQAREVLFT